MSAVEHAVPKRPGEPEAGRMDLQMWRRVVADQAWVEAHWPEVAAYGGQWLAICGGRIVLADPDGRRFAARLQRSRYRDRVPFILRVPSPEELASPHPAGHPV